MFRRLATTLFPLPAVMLPFRHRRGLSAEDHAARYLKKQGWRLLGQRVRTATGSDIDILAVDGNALVFVEVRSKQAESLISAEASIRHKKQKSMRANVRFILRKRRVAILRPRIDVIAVDMEGDRIIMLRHHRAALPWDSPSRRDSNADVHTYSTYVHMDTL